jgi:hypothetical protein
MNSNTLGFEIFKHFANWFCKVLGLKLLTKYIHNAIGLVHMIRDIL